MSKEQQTNFKSGFVNILGLPNAGKSTLTNALLGTSLNITNAKPQTTRHRIHGIINDDNYQIIIADTPGYIDNPDYEMQKSMNRAALSVMEDADILLLVMDLTDSRVKVETLFLDLINKSEATVFLILNKTDLVKDIVVLSELAHWSKVKKIAEIVPMSGLKKRNVDTLLKLIKLHLPDGPAYFDPEDMSDRPVRFFVREIIRKHILDLYSREIPYSCEVIIEEFKDRTAEKEKTLIRAVIFVLRNSQKNILIGKDGVAIKRLGMRARKEIESFISQGVFLELRVKVSENWRNDEQDLKKLGYS